MQLRFIKLFEDYEKELKINSSETSHTWTEVRDAIQMKKPFVIIIFRTKSSYDEALKEHFDSVNYIKQIAILHKDSKKIKYPSIFFVLESDRDYKEEVLELYEKYDIKQVIVGKTGFDYSILYSQDGSSTPLGNEIVSTIDPSTLRGDDHFKIGSTYYSFINFVG